MLVLARHVGESFSIGDEVTVTLVSVKPGSAKIGIDAPRSLAIVRDNAIRTIPKVSKEAIAYQLLKEFCDGALPLQPVSSSFDQLLVRADSWGKVKAFFYAEMMEQMAVEAANTVEGGVQ